MRLLRALLLKLLSLLTGCKWLRTRSECDGAELKGEGGDEDDRNAQQGTQDVGCSCVRKCHALPVSRLDYVWSSAHALPTPFRGRVAHIVATLA